MIAFLPNRRNKSYLDRTKRFFRIYIYISSLPEFFFFFLDSARFLPAPPFYMFGGARNRVRYELAELPFFESFRKRLPRSERVLLLTFISDEFVHFDHSVSP